MPELFLRLLAAHPGALRRVGRFSAGQASIGGLLVGNRITHEAGPVLFIARMEALDSSGAC